MFIHKYILHGTTTTTRKKKLEEKIVKDAMKETIEVNKNFLLYLNNIKNINLKEFLRKNNPIEDMYGKKCNEYIFKLEEIKASLK